MNGTILPRKVSLHGFIGAAYIRERFINKYIQSYRDTILIEPERSGIGPGVEIIGGMTLPIHPHLHNYSVIHTLNVI